MVELNDSTCVDNFGCICRNRMKAKAKQGGGGSSSLIEVRRSNGSDSSSSSSSSQSAAASGGGGTQPVASRRTEAGREQLIIDEMASQFVSEHNYLLNSSYLKGDAVLSNFSGLVLCQAFFNPHIGRYCRAVTCRAVTCRASKYT
jgi:hypothetical protein